MSRAVRFAMAMIVSLGLLTWGALTIVQRTTRSWFEKDLRLRVDLVMSGARQALLSHWEKDDRRALERVLADIARDERIMAAAACGTDLSFLAGTDEFPEAFGCVRVGPHLRPAADSPADLWVPWSVKASLPGGPVHVSAVPIVGGSQPFGFVVLVHDLSFVARREALTRRSLLAAFAVLAMAASILTVIFSRLSWRDWSDEIRRFLQGDTERPEFRPILGDVRRLVDRVMLEHEADGSGAGWTPDRLKQTLNRYLHREKVVLVANREPYIHERGPDGRIDVVHPASGLVTALEPVMRACSGVWVAHGGGSADRESADRHGRVRVPPDENSYVLRRVWLSPEEERGYYYGFANEGLWPLCHLAHARPTFRTEDWRHYQEVNRKFADAVCEEVEGEDPIVLVQDYHFTLLPRLIRKRLPRATVLMFLHIPWPNSERFGVCPWRQELLEGMLGAGILGFHTQYHCNNFLDSVDRYLEARLDRAENAVVLRGRQTLVRAYPISVEWPVRWLRDLPPAQECRRQVFAELGLPPNALLGLGVDRLDYTKGVEERFLAVERLLDRFPEFRGRFTFVQLAAPSRTLIDRYRQLNERVESLAARINARFEDGPYRPIVLLRAHHEPPAVFRYYRAADVCYVSSLHDGMNLVAKEFGAARDDERGVLVLSEFTGAARELTEALIVNPYDLEQASEALAAALRMPPEAQRDRMRSMRAFLAEFNVYRWAGRMLVDAARLRRQERLAGRLHDGDPDPRAVLS